MGPREGPQASPCCSTAASRPGCTPGWAWASRALSTGLGTLADLGVGPALKDSEPGRTVNAAVNGIIGDRLARERPRLAVPLAVRREGADVPLRTDALRSAFPEATGRVAVLLHGLSESESWFDRHRDVVGATYADTLASLGWAPVLLRANTGLGLRENGAALSGLLQDLTEAWPVPVDRMALVGHSMGGLIVRAACAVRSEASRPWDGLVTDVVTLGTPHLGAPLAGGVGTGARALTRLPEPAAFGRILDQRWPGCSTSSTGWTTTCRRCRTRATTWSRRPSPARRVIRWAASSVTSWCASRRRTAVPPVDP